MHLLKHFLNRKFLSLRLYKKAALAFTFFALLMTLCCGKRKPPLPPVERVAQRVEISGFQRGNQIILSWRMPARNASDASILNIHRADIYRLAEPIDSPLTLSEEEFASRSTLIATKPIKNDDFALQRISYTDQLEFSGQSARLRYAIRFVNASGQKAAFSNFLIIEPTAKVAASPDSLQAETAAETINLRWNAPQANADGTKPVNLLGYNIYRSASAQETAKLLNEKPVSDTDYSDRFFEFGNEYFYFVRSVSVGSGGEPIESLESNIVRIKPIDTFAPDAPDALTIAAAPNTLSLFFAVNTEKDIAGYKIYRTTDPNLPKSGWSLITPEILTVNTFQDSAVESGKTYFYYITAIDKAGNTSQPSEVVTETAP
jgi:predicted phage tail protein